MKKKRQRNSKRQRDNEVSLYRYLGRELAKDEERRIKIKQTEEDKHGEHLTENSQ